MHEIEGLLNSPGFWFTIVVGHLIGLAINRVFKIRVGWFNAVILSYSILSFAVATYCVFFSGFHEREAMAVATLPNLMLVMLYGIFPSTIAALLTISDEGDWLGPITLKIIFVVLVCVGHGLTIYALVKSPLHEWRTIAVMYSILVCPIIINGILVAAMFYHAAVSITQLVRDSAKASH